MVIVVVHPTDPRTWPIRPGSGASVHPGGASPRCTPNLFEIRSVVALPVVSSDSLPGVIVEPHRGGSAVVDTIEIRDRVRPYGI